MGSARLLRTLAVVLVVLALFYGVLEVFMTRYEDPTAYPAYSTFRADPLGARVFYGALQRVNGVTVERNQLPLNYAVLPDDATVIFAGADVTPDSVRVLERLEEFLERGGRLVITHAPCGEDSGDCWNDVDDQPDHLENGKDTPPYAQSAYISQRWGFDYESDPFPGSLDYAVLTEGNKAALRKGFPLLLPWRSELHFTALDDAWRIRYALEGRPVVIERTWGKGSIVVASDTYFLSNEAMRADRHPALLAWLAGPKHRVVFDESHFGLISSPGIIDLFYRLRLQGFLAVLLVLAALYVWMSLVAPTPRREATALELTAKTRGREAFSGMVSLLRRSVPQADLLQRCHAVWRESLPLLGPHAKRLAAELEQAIEEAGGDAPREQIVENYRRICRINQEKR